MKLSLFKGGAGIAAFVRRLAAWRFGALVAKAAAIAAGLVLLAVIGRSALAVAGAQPAAPAPSSVPVPVVSSSGGVSPPAPPSTGEPNSPTSPSPPSPPPSSGRRLATPEDPVILNQATIDDLVRLPGIGQKRAQTILAVRTRLGRFRQIEDLLKVKGIGRATLRRLRPLVRLDAPPLTDAGPRP